MEDLKDILQWALATSGGLAALFSFFLKTKINKQQYQLNKLKTKFDYLVIERNKVIEGLNSCIADIQLWMDHTRSQCDDADQIKIDGFRKSVLQLEIQLTHGRYLLSSQVYAATHDLLAECIRCIDLYNQQVDVISSDLNAKSPNQVFSEAFFKPETRQMITDVFECFSKEIADE
ncbi:hypothetical protein [Alistipes timonensis]